MAPQVTLRSCDSLSDGIPFY